MLTTVPEIIVYFYLMRITRIVIDVPIDGALINCVQLWTLKYVDNAPSFFKGNYKVLLGIIHSNRTEIINTNGNSICAKLILESMATGGGCTICAIGMILVAGGQTSAIIIDAR